MDYIQLELYHHGILGQKWGDRNGPPYPLQRSQMTSSERKRNSTDSKKHMQNLKGEKKERTGLTEKQKKALIIGAAIAGTALAAYGTYKIYGNYIGKGSEIDPITGLRKLARPMTDEENLKQINPGRIRFLSKNKNLEIIEGSSSNCMLCTTTYELRKRGFDVHAGYSTTGFSNELFTKVFKNPPPVSTISNSVDRKKTYDALVSSLSAQGDGARGNIMVKWRGLFSGGHSMIWENINGETVFMDGQTNTVYKDFAKTILRNTDSTSPIEFIRTDNLEIDFDKIKEYINIDTVTKTYIDHGAEIAANLISSPEVQFVSIGTLGAGVAVYNNAKHKKAGGR